MCFFLLKHWSFHCKWKKTQIPIHTLPTRTFRKTTGACESTTLLVYSYAATCYPFRYFIVYTIRHCLEKHHVNLKVDWTLSENRFHIHVICISYCDTVVVYLMKIKIIIQYIFYWKSKFQQTLTTISAWHHLFWLISSSLPKTHLTSLFI